MAVANAPIALSGLASGLDTTSIINGLVQAESAPMQQMQSQQSSINSAVSELSTLGQQLSALSKAAGALSDASTVGSFTATSSSSAVVAQTSGAAQAGDYQVTVNSLASEQRTYSASFSSESSALGMSGSFSIQIGSGTATPIKVSSTDSLDSIAAKINDAGIRANASIFFDGSNYRLQIRGLDTGASNAITFTESGTSLDLNGTGATSTSGKTVQQASDASVTIDGFTATRPTNQITGIIPGVTLAVTQKTSSPVDIQVASDPSALNTNVQAVVSAYNAVISAIHDDAGYGSNAANNPNLASNTTLRSIASSLANNMEGVFGTGRYQSLADVGVTLQQDGTLAVDTTKLDAAFTADPTTVEKIFGRAPLSSSGGAMASLRDLADSITTASVGMLAVASQSLTDQSNRLTQSITTQQQHITQYQAQLQAEFSAMETQYSANQTLLNQLSKMSTTTG
ncbi:MAG TPA: flagellar filament capping protein FliD [Polyangiaceae bacterium]|nr:flagellar filament capping protein FliD [Polyangiaceae bacterium]